MVRPPGPSSSTQVVPLLDGENPSAQHTPDPALLVLLDAHGEHVPSYRAPTLALNFPAAQFVHAVLLVLPRNVPIPQQAPQPWELLSVLLPQGLQVDEDAARWAGLNEPEEHREHARSDGAAR